MFDRDINFILQDRYPPGWSPDEARRIKELFCQMRPVVPAILVKSLWQYWYTNNRDQLLFEEIGDNIALLLHARAYGEQVPDTDDDNFLGKLLKRHRTLFATPALSLLKWGPRAILSQNALAGLTSPILHAWVFTKDAAAQQILIVGQGLPEIRQQVLTHAFTTSLRVHAVANDIMNIGILRIELPGYSQTAEDIPINPIGVQGGNPALLSPDAKKTALEAMQEFHGYLLSLSEKTGLVQIHEGKTDDQTVLTSTYKKYAKQAAVDNVAFLSRQSHQKDETDLVTLVPYWHIARNPLVLALSLSADLLKTDSYKQLFKAYQTATFDRIVADTSIRRDHYRHEAERLEAEKKRFDDATLPERDKFWEKTVRLVQRFEFKLGITTKLFDPKEIPIEEYYKVNVPKLIKEYRDWEERMENILSSLKKSKERPDAPIHRFAISRFIDAALREQYPDESHETLAAFEVWRTQVRSLLWFEWRNHLEQLEISEKHIFTSHTLFHSTFSLTKDGSDTTEVMISPYTLIDQQRSIGLFDPEFGVTVVQNEAEYALPFTSAPQSIEGHWNKLVALANQPGIEGKAFTMALREALRQNPSAMMERILEQLFESHQVGETKVNKGAQSGEEMLDTLGKAIGNTALSRGINHAILGRRVLAYHTARNAVSNLIKRKHESKWTARFWLMLVLVECEANGQSVLSALDDRTRWSTHKDIRVALEQAKAANSQDVKDWINVVQKNPERTIGWFLQDLPPAEKTCKSDEYAALLARGAIESARLARELKQAIASLSEEHELITTAFAKVGWALEEALLADLVGGLEGDLIDLVRDLTAEEPLKYLGTEGAS